MRSDLKLLFPLSVAITGPVGSGKTKTAIELYRLCVSRNWPVVVFSPTWNTRDGNVLQAKDASCPPVEAVPYGGALDLLADGLNARYVFLDEINLLPKEGWPSLGRAIRHLNHRGITFIGLGCDLTSELDPYSPMAEYIDWAECTYRLFGKCVDCGDSAPYSWYVGNQPPPEDSEDSRVGNDFVPVCSVCHAKRKVGRDGPDKSSTGGD